MRKAAIHAAPNDVLSRNNSVRVELRNRFNVAYQDRGKNETFIIDLPGAFGMLRQALYLSIIYGSNRRLTLRRIWDAFLNTVVFAGKSTLITGEDGV
jgi:hypothetical protein